MMRFNSLNKPPSSSPTPIARFLQVGAVGLSLAHGASQAATIEVTSNADNNGAGCTLREAVVSINTGGAELGGCSNIATQEINTNPPLGPVITIPVPFGINDRIEFNLQGGIPSNGNTIRLTAGELTINNSVLTIDASNALLGSNPVNGITIDANNASRVLNIDDSTVTLENLTLSGGSATGSGGGLNVGYSTVTLNNSTVSGNSAADDGGGLLVYDSSTITLVNSIIANSGDGDDVSGTGALTSDSNSIIEEASFAGSRTGDPGLLPLADNGGPTQTHALSASSIARNTGDLATCTTTDQRGITRNDGDGTCDVGALEFDPALEADFFIIPLGNGRVAVVPL